MSVLTPIVLDHLNRLQDQYKEANWSDMGGAVLVVVPGFKLPRGWSKSTATIRFVVPLGYPVARPDCFWADPDLRLEGNRTPQNTGFNLIPGTQEQLLWFSWHLQDWNANQSSLLTWLKVI